MPSDEDMDATCVLVVYGRKDGHAAEEAANVAMVCSTACVLAQHLGLAAPSRGGGEGATRDGGGGHIDIYHGPPPP